jgi:hypothetical protein
MPVLLRLDVVSATADLPEKARTDLASIRQSILSCSGSRVDCVFSSDPFDQRDEAQLTRLHEWWEDLQPIVVDALPPHSIVEAKIAPICRLSLCRRSAGADSHQPRHEFSSGDGAHAIAATGPVHPR